VKKLKFIEMHMELRTASILTEYLLDIGCVELLYQEVSIIECLCE